MPKDRLAALKACQDQHSQDDSFTSIEMSDLNKVRETTSVEEFYKECEELISSIDRLADDVEDVKKTHSLILSTPQIDDNVKKHLETVMSTIQGEAKKIKIKLKNMSQVNEQRDPLSAEHRIRATQHQMLTRKFAEVITEYQITQADYRDRCKARIQRQLEITGRVTTDDEIEEMIESGNPAIFTRGIEMETQQAKQTLAEIEARHCDIMKLEKSIMELRDLFVDMATLVEVQGEMVNRIENHVALSKSHVDKASEEVKTAIAYRSKARLKKFICLTILILFVVGIVMTAIYV